MTLFEISSSIRAAAGTVWHIDFANSYTQLRADIGRLKVRVVVPKPGQSTAEVPAESNSQLHIVTSLSNLKAWLAEMRVS